MTDVVLTEFDAHVLTVTLNRPEALNAINAEMSERVGEILAAADAEPEVRVVVIRGAGRAFCVGADLKAVSQGHQVRSKREDWGFAGITRHPIGKPLIASVHGHVLGGGLEIVLACDLAVAASNASLGQPEVKRGVIAAAGGAFRLPAQIPAKLAMELLLTGAPIDAQRAYSWGLVNRVVDPAELDRATSELARQVAANAPLAVQASKRIARRAPMLRDAEEAWATSRGEAEAVLASADVHEGVAAFIERREPRWEGR